MLPFLTQQCRNNGWIMENMDKELTVPKWVLIVWRKIPKMPQNFSAQFVCSSPKVWDFNEKMFHWASVVHEWNHGHLWLKLFCLWGFHSLVWIKTENWKLFKLFHSCTKINVKGIEGNCWGPQLLTGGCFLSTSDRMWGYIYTDAM